MKTRALILTSISSAVLLLASCGGGNQQAGGAAAGGAPPVQSYPVFKVTQQTATINSQYPATLQGQQNIEIRPKIDGYIEQIFIDEGAVVIKGQLLFRINAPQYQQDVNNSAAAISSAQADVSAAQLQVNKVKPLVEKDIISKFDLESAQYTLQARKAALAQAKANLNNAKTNLAYTNVTSPVNGVVGTIPYKLGSLVNSNTAQPLTTVSNIGNIYAYFSLNEKQLLDFGRKYEGETIAAKLSKLPEVSLILSDGSTFSEKGKVQTVSGLINTQTGSASFRASFPNPLGILRSGGSAKVSIPETIKDAILVPQKSTYELQGKRFVYVVDANGKIKSTEIEIVDQPAGQYFVVTKGINAGDTVVFESTASLMDGTPIKADMQPDSKVYQDLK
ncbi:efflux RND transporter periplasmic adaptor subunit [Mucilaginibacter pallidiroseus]|uniref:Efflux RND transporter periplasmic adaptor subunit n=1 Tax=Mucilaginibacter pallidiroseus TaxID=2599295 RepID=A0A563U2Z0_9SPHI|nr:efflux RND transporter periplasmic adaptor subunit [Mucilaginibacter pallidiroseus]TWR25700.1 efflux RND transporter periplasmic adaptor subunit [Mucilaginibacter pallidiroseus]